MNSDRNHFRNAIKTWFLERCKNFKINTPRLKKFFKYSSWKKYISFSEFFNQKVNNNCKRAEVALLTKPIERGTFWKDIIKLDEKLNIIYSVFNGSLLNIFPKFYENETIDDNYKWYSPLEAIQNFSGQNQVAISQLVRGLLNSVAEYDWVESDKYVELIAMYQEKAGASVIPSNSKINAEILFNKLDHF